MPDQATLDAARDNLRLYDTSTMGVREWRGESLRLEIRFNPSSLLLIVPSKLHHFNSYFELITFENWPLHRLYCLQVVNWTS